MCANLGQVDEPVDLSQQMIVRHMPLKTEAVEQRLLHHPCRSPIIDRISRAQKKKESATGAPIKRSFFNAIDQNRTIEVRRW